MFKNNVKNQSAPRQESEMESDDVLEHRKRRLEEGAAPVSNSMHRGDTPEVKRSKVTELSPGSVLVAADVVIERMRCELAEDQKNSEIADKLQKAIIENRQIRLQYQIGPCLEQLLATTVEEKYLSRVTALAEEFKDKYLKGDLAAIEIVNAALISQAAFDAAMRGPIAEFTSIAAAEYATKTRLANRQAKLTFKIRPSLNRLLAAVESTDLSKLLAQQNQFSEAYLAGNAVLISEVDASMRTISEIKDISTSHIDEIVKELMQRCATVLAPVEPILTVFNHIANQQSEIPSPDASTSKEQLKM